MGNRITKESLQSDTEYNREEIEFICDLLSFVLCNNYFMFGSQFYLQITGNTMGSNLAPTLAVMFMNCFEEHFVYNHECFLTHVKVWCSYIDDVFFIWQSTTESLDIFHGYLNSCLPTISFSLERDKSRLAFLDVML